MMIALMFSVSYASAKPLHHKHYSWEGKKRKHRRHLVPKHLTRPRHKNVTTHSKANHGHSSSLEQSNTIRHSH